MVGATGRANVTRSVIESSLWANVTSPEQPHSSEIYIILVLFIVSVLPVNVLNELSLPPCPLPSKLTLFKGIDSYTSLTRTRFKESRQDPS